MSSFNMRMRNVAFQRWLYWKLSFINNPSGENPYAINISSSSNPSLPSDPKAKSGTPDMPDLSDGLVLVDLMTVLNIPALGKFNKKPKTPKEKFKNLTKALISFRGAGCIIPEHVTPEQLRKGNPVAIMDLLWGIIYRSHAPQITESNMEFLFMDELLFWCLTETRDYPGINQENIHASLCDGLAWCALVHKFEPDALNYQMTYYASSKLKRKASETCKLAFDAGEKYLNIPKLLEPKSFDKGTIDELSLIIYLACWYDRLGGPRETKKGEGEGSVVPDLSKDRKKDDKKRLAEEKRKEQERKDSEKRQEDLKKRQEEIDLRISEEARKEEEKIAKAKKKEKEKLEKQKKKAKGASNTVLIPLLFQGFEDDFVTFRTYSLEKYISVAETYEIVSKDLGLKSEDFVLIQRKKGQEVLVLPEEERLLFKDKEKTDKYLICTKKTALKPEQLDICKKKKMN